MEPLVSPSLSPKKPGLTKEKILIAIGGLLVVVVVGAYALNSSPNVYKGSVAEIPDCSVDAADGEPEVYVDAKRGCVAVSQLEAEKAAALVVVPKYESAVATRVASRVATPQLNKGDTCTDANGNPSYFDGKKCVAAPKAGDVCTLDGAVKGVYVGQPATCVPLNVGDAEGDKKDKVVDSDKSDEGDKTVLLETVVAAIPDVGGAGGVTSASEEAAFRVQMLEQQLAIQKANEANMSQEEMAKQAQKAREEEAAAFAAAAQAAKNKSLGIETPVAPEVAPASVPALDVTDENATPIENPFAEAIANPIVESELAAPSAEETNSDPEAATSQSANAAVSATANNSVSAANSRAAATATNANGLHGAAIRGESGPEVLIYPAILGLAQGAYLVLRRKNNNK